MSGHLQNLKPWPKGVSGNPAGRPKSDLSVEIARAVFEHNPEAIYNAMVRRLTKGDVRAFQILADRAYGKVKDRVEVDPLDSYAERLEAARKRALDGLTDSELQEKIDALQKELASHAHIPGIQEIVRSK